MVRARNGWDSIFQELKDLVRPDTADFGGGGINAADARRRIYDGTAPWALEQLAAGLHSYNTSPVDRWFSIGVAGRPLDSLPFDAKGWLQTVADLIYAQYCNPYAGFNSSLHENYLDLGGLGTSVLYQWFDTAKGALMFRPYPLADIWVREDSAGRVDTVHRLIKWTVRQVKQEFGYLPERLSKMDDCDMVKVVHSVCPREDYEPGSRHKLLRRYSSCYVCLDTEEFLDEGGYRYMPYHVPRWSKLAGELYGRSPALSVFPEIRMVNAMSKTMIVAAQKMVDPALQIEDDGFLLPLKTSPGSYNFRRPGAEPIVPMPTAQRIDVGVDMIEQRREVIRRGFYVDWLVRPTKKERQTAQEIMDDRNQMLSMMGPVVGRIQGELLGPMISLSYNSLAEHGILPPMPNSLQEAELEPIYISPAAKAQSTVRGQGIQSYVGQLTQLLPVLPGLMDSINEDGLNAELQDLTDVPHRVLNDPKTTQAKRAAREKQTQMAQATQVAPAAAKAAKDLAQAKQMGGGLQQLQQELS